MANMGKVFKEEVERISQRVARNATQKLRKELMLTKAALRVTRGEVSALRKQISARPTVAPTVSQGSAEPSTSRRSARRGMTARGVVALRKKLGLSQEQLGKLSGVTAQAVNLWEHKTGTLKLRHATAQALDEIRGIGKRDVGERLEKIAKNDTCQTSAPRKKAGKQRSKKSSARSRKRSA